MKKKISNEKTVKKLEKRLYNEIIKEYNRPDGFYCYIPEVALTFPDGKESMYTIDVSYGFNTPDGTEVHRYINEMVVAKGDGKIEIPFVAGQVIQYITDKGW